MIATRTACAVIALCALIGACTKSSTDGASAKKAELGAACDKASDCVGGAACIKQTCADDSLASFCHRVARTAWLKLAAGKGGAFRSASVASIRKACLAMYRPKQDKHPKRFKTFVRCELAQASPGGNNPKCQKLLRAK